MILKHTKIVIALMVIFTGFALFARILNNKTMISPGIVHHFNLNEQTANYLTTKEDLLSWLENEEKSVWNELKKTINLSFEECEALKKNRRAEYKEDLIIVRENYATKEPLSPETINCIQSIMREFKIDPTTVPIVGCNHGSAAAATDEFILVDEKAFNSHTLKVKKFVVGHELIHFLKQDHSTNFFINEYAKKSHFNHNNNNNPINRLSQLHELRADILSSLHGEDYAQGSILFFNEHIEKHGELSGPPCHPTSSLRLQLGNKIAALDTLSLTQQA